MTLMFFIILWLTVGLCATIVVYYEDTRNVPHFYIKQIKCYDPVVGILAGPVLVIGMLGVLITKIYLGFRQK